MSESKEEKNNFLENLFVTQALARKWNFRKIIQKDLKFHHEEDDPKELAETIPPASENIEFHCCWVTEVYEPSNIDGLITALKKIGWDKPERVVRDESLTEFIKQGRRIGIGGSWMNGGIILSPGDNKRFFGAKVRRIKLPQGVDYAHLSILNVTSSLTLLTMHFVFNDDPSRLLNELFNSSYRTQVKYQPSLLKAKYASFLGAVEQKRQAIRKSFDEVHANLYAWFNNYFPGHYCASGEGVLPTIDLITSHLYEQQSEKDRPMNYYIDLLFEPVTEIWTSEGNSNLELRLRGWNTEKPVAALFGNFEKLSQNIEHYGGENRHGLTNKLNRDFKETMALWTTHHLLLSYERQLSAIRDRTIFQVKRTHQALKSLDYVRQHLLLISKNTRAACNDILALLKHNRYAWKSMDFKPPSYFKDFPNFVDSLRQQDATKIRQLIKLEQHVNATITATANLSSTIANLRIQRNVLWLTIFVALLTVLSFIGNNNLSTIKQLFSYLADILHAL